MTAPSNSIAVEELQALTFQLWMTQRENARLAAINASLAAQLKQVEEVTEDGVAPDA